VNKGFSDGTLDGDDLDADATALFFKVKVSVPGDFVGDTGGMLCLFGA